MDDTTRSGAAGVKTGRATAGANSKTSRSGASDNTTSTAQLARQELIRLEMERLSKLSPEEALAEVREELANLLVVYQNLGGAITAISLPEGREILAHRHILVLPARKGPDGSYSLSVPE